MFRFVDVWISIFALWVLCLELDVCCLFMFEFESNFDVWDSCAEIPTPRFAAMMLTRRSSASGMLCVPMKR